jgi:hypothetical protein
MQVVTNAYGDDETSMRENAGRKTTWTTRRANVFAKLSRPHYRTITRNEGKSEIIYFRSQNSDPWRALNAQRRCDNRGVRTASLHRTTIEVRFGSPELREARSPSGNVNGVL